MLIVILVALAAISTVSILLAYAALQNTESRLDLAATDELRRKMSEDASEVAAETSTNLDIISRTLQTAASSPILLRGADSEEARILLDAASIGTEQYTLRINYLDLAGTLVYTTEPELQGSIGSDRSNAQYYVQIKEKNQPTLTGLFKTTDDKMAVSVAAPVFAPPANSFNGVLVAIIPTESIINKIEERLTVTTENQVFIVTNNGTIIGHRDPVVVGKNIFGELGTQNVVVSKNLQLMTDGRSGVFEYSTPGGKRFVAAYSPVTFSGVRPWSVLIVTTHAQNEAFFSILNEQRIFTIFGIILIAIITAIFMTFIFMINRRLQGTVQSQDVQIKSQFDHLQEAYERLTEQDKIKDEFINVAAHELRTPVLPIILSAEGLAEDMGTEDSKVEIILRNAKRINKLTNDILDVSRIKSNSFKLQKERINIRKLIEETIQDILFKVAANPNPHLKIRFDSKLTPAKEEIMADRGRINQVISNLLDNAFNFTDEGTIVVTLKHVEKWASFIEIRVADTGKGIDPSIRPRLFEKFVTKSEKAKGTGLGLYLCKAIVEAHGGKIWADDNVEAGRGAIFAFTLPVEAS